MKLKYSILNAGLSLLFALPALSASEGLVNVVPRTKSIVEDTSEHRRIGQNYLLTVQVAGSAVMPIPGGGLTFGKYLDCNSLWQVEIFGGSLPYLFFDVGATTIGANYKHFYGNSFYTKLGADYRKITLSNFNLSYYEGDKTLGSAESLTASFAIGNQWQWENFTLGCDWIGVNPTLAVLGAKYDTTGINPDDKEELDNSWNKLAKVTSAQFLRFYLGASF